MSVVMEFFFAVDGSFGIFLRLIKTENNVNVNLNLNFARWRSPFFSLQKRTEKTEKNRNFCLRQATATVTLTLTLTLTGLTATLTLTLTLTFLNTNCLGSLALASFPLQKKTEITEKNRNLLAGARLSSSLQKRTEMTEKNRNLLADARLLFHYRNGRKK